jgi:hypothetical protein
MSNLWFNIRFGVRHFQIGPNTFRFAINPRQVELRKTNPNWKWFEIIMIFGKYTGYLGD